jgi:hypothetical protein
MTPAELASQKQINKRIKIFEDRRTSNHYPHKITRFSKYPNIYGKPIFKVDNDIFKVTDLMKKLVGYNHLNKTK